jgi:hypothetical protein
MSKNNSKIKEKEEIDKIKDYLQTITDSERSEIIEKMKFYYGKYINELKIQNNKLIPNKNNTNYKSLRSKYYNNSSVNKTITNTPRFVMKFKQNIYEREIQELIHFLIGNFNIFENFMSIILFVAKKRRIIELLKLNLETSNSFVDLRASVSNIEKSFISDITESNGEHLVSYIRSLQLPYSVKYNEITLTRIGYHPTYNKLYWFHTSQIHIYRLLMIINSLYIDLLKSISHIKNNENMISRNSNRNNKEESKLKLSELYWLYMQTCPFFRGSASIGEIIFSALLQKYFNSNFRLFTETYDKKLIPDIYALTYPLEKFHSIFWTHLVSKI